MLHVTRATLPSILAPDEGPVAEVLQASGTADLCLVCEHASPFIPASLGELGLADRDRLSHAVWDIGALALARGIANRLDAPLVAARISRLVFDLNRPTDHANAMPERTETIDIKGNSNLTSQDKAARIAEIHDPFHATLADTLDGFDAPPMLVTIHSFTPTWHGQARAVELGLLHDDNPTLARAMLKTAPSTIRAELNAPYDASDGVTHMLKKHALPRGLDNVMIEVRNDLLQSDEGVARWVDILSDMLERALTSEVAQ